MDSMKASDGESLHEDDSPFLDFSFFPLGEETASFPSLETENVDLDNDLSDTFCVLPDHDEFLALSRPQNSHGNISGKVASKCNTNKDGINITEMCGKSNVQSENSTGSYNEDIDIANLLKSIESDSVSEMCHLEPEAPSLMTVPVHSTSSSRSTDDTDENIIVDITEDEPRIKHFQEEMWNTRYKELLLFVKEKGHAAVPHTYPRNQQLARWVKRQRRQYKLWLDGKPSTITSERLDLLHSVGFVWDSHDINWREKLDVLEEFRLKHGHVNVPTKYEDKQLAIWVKCQRRQYKLFKEGKPSAMTPTRMLELEKKGFEWGIRNTKKAASKKVASKTVKKSSSVSSAPPAKDLSIDSIVSLMQTT